MSTTMVGMGKDLHNTEKEMEYYASKLHQVEKHIEVSNMFSFGIISSLCFHSWNCVIFNAVPLLMLKTLFSLLYMDFMVPFGSIRSLYGSVIVVLLLMLHTIISLLYKDLCLHLKAYVTYDSTLESMKEYCYSPSYAANTFLSFR